MKQEPGRQQPGISGLQAGEDVKPDGCRIESHHCEEHGDVPPMRSAIVNPALPAAVWDGEGP